MKSKFWYIAMKVGIFIAYFTCILLSLVNRLFYLGRRSKDTVVYLHSPLYSDGYFRRFKLFDDQFEKKSRSLDFFSLIDEDTSHQIFGGDKFYKRYKLFLYIAFKRAIQVSKAPRYKNIFVQRILFPFYPDYSSLFFERVLSFMGGNRILDIWDPVHIWHPKLTFGSFKYYNKLSVNTNLLKVDYSKHFDEKNIFIWPIAVDVNRFERKIDPNKNNITLFYTGSSGNTKNYLEPLIPILEKVSQKFKIELLVIGAYSPKSDIINIIHQKWSEENIKNAIECSDFGLYPNFQKEKTKNYTVAGKVLDYMSAKLPIIGADQGLPEGIDISKAIFNAESLEDWESQLVLAFDSQKLANEKATYAYNFVNENLNISKVYSILEDKLLVK